MEAELESVASADGTDTEAGEVREVPDPIRVPPGGRLLALRRTGQAVRLQQCLEGGRLDTEPEWAMPPRPATTLTHARTESGEVDEPHPHRHSAGRPRRPSTQARLHAVAP
jgi:hypothetical protein